MAAAAAWQHRNLGSGDGQMGATTQVHEYHNLDYCQGTPQLQCLGSTTSEPGHKTLVYGRYYLDTAVKEICIQDLGQRVTVAAP